MRRLHAAWATREPIVIALGGRPAALPPAAVVRRRAVAAGARRRAVVRPAALPRRGPTPTTPAPATPVWWWARQGRPPRRRAPRRRRTGRPTSCCPTAQPAWVDGGPRSPRADPAHAVVHGESVDAGVLVRRPAARSRRPPTWPPTSSPPSPIGGGPARVDRTRPARARRGCSPSACATSTSTAATSGRRSSPSPTTSRPSWRWRRAPPTSGPRVRTLNSLGLWVLAEHRGGVAARARRAARCAAWSTSLLPGRRQRRANTDPIGPYVEGLTAIRLGLTDPDEVEAARDDVPGLAELFPAYRRQLAERGAVDFDEQIYAAVEALLHRRRVPPLDAALVPPPPRRRVPGPHAGPRAADPPAGAARRSTCSASATTTSASTATPAPTRRSSSTTSGCSPAPSPHPLTVNYRCPVEVVDGARTLLGYNHRRVAKQIERRPGERPRPPARCASSSTVATTGRRPLVAVVRGWLDEPGVDAGVDRRARPGQLVAAGAARRAARGRRAGRRRCCDPTCSSAPACAPRSPTCASPRRRRRDGRRATSSRSCAGRPAACRSGSPSASTGGRGGRSPQLAALADQVPDKDSRQGAAPRRRPRCRARRRPRPARRATCSRPCATRSAWARR